LGCDEEMEDTEMTIIAIICLGLLTGVAVSEANAV
jgi:hypothetical protein